MQASSLQQASYGALQQHDGMAQQGKKRGGASLEELKATLIFEKVLTSSDTTGSTGRIVVPKAQAVQHLPHLERQDGIDLEGVDTFGNPHTFKFRFWINNQSRMYLLEGTKPIQHLYHLKVGDVIQFAKLPDGMLLAAGRRGTKNDVIRKAPQRREKVGSGEKQRSGGQGTSRRRGPVAERLVRRTIRHGDVEYYFDPQKDGVFRAVPQGITYPPRDHVLCEGGVWSVVLQLAGETYQAFFESEFAAHEALNASCAMPPHVPALPATMQMLAAPVALAPGVAGFPGGTPAQPQQKADPEPPGALMPASFGSLVMQ